MTSRAAVALAAVALLLLATSPTTHAQWKWRDAEGRITASDRPPPRDVPDKDILQRPAPQPVRAASPAPTSTAGATPAGTTKPAPTALDKEVEARRQAEKADKEAKAKAEEDKLNAMKAENCRRARQNLATLESGTRLVRNNDKGEPEVLDDAGRAAEAAKVREVIASDCR